MAEQQDETPTIEIVINKRYGGFGLSRAALDEIVKMGYKFENPEYPDGELSDMRHNSHLVKVVKMLGESASGDRAKLVVQKIPEELKDYYVVNEYDGMETITYDWDIFLKTNLESLDDDNVDEWKERVERLLAAVGVV
jgi:hypothetical protein